MTVNMLTRAPVDFPEPVAGHTVLDYHLDRLRRSHVHDGPHGLGKQIITILFLLVSQCLTSLSGPQDMVWEKLDAIQQGERRSLRFELLAFLCLSALYIDSGTSSKKQF